MGFYLMTIAKLRDVRLTGVDSDPDRVAQARREVPSAEVVQADAQMLPFEDGSFDAVLLTEVLEHLPDDRAALAELRRVLRPGGVLAVSVPHRRYPFWWDPISATWSALGGAPIRSGPLVGIWTNHERLYLPAELENLLAASSFAIEELRQATHYCFPFSHFLVYGIGKPLVERGLVPRRLEASADRLRGLENDSSLLNPFNAVRAAFRLVDRLNDRADASRVRTYVNVLAKARKPADGGP
jgi:SAM-dependent methyltransferase